MLSSSLYKYVILEIGRQENMLSSSEDKYSVIDI